ncbi:hypothetical protein, partial [Klebsiella pneumoniae]|uniref:hypothetical protein n=1 Tax=Klebsiella pneumoniae TaxID=573 RepID=UPI001BDFE755
MEIVYSDPNPPKDDGNTFPIGFMRPEYATMNKIIHRNLYCRGSTPASRIDEVNLLIEFMG